MSSLLAALSVRHCSEKAEHVARKPTFDSGRYEAFGVEQYFDIIGLGHVRVTSMVGVKALCLYRSRVNVKPSFFSSPSSYELIYKYAFSSIRRLSLLCCLLVAMGKALNKQVNHL